MVAHLIDALADDVHPEAALLAAVEDRRPHGRRVEALTKMMQAEHDAIVEGFSHELNAAVGAIAIRVPHHVARGFRHRELELVDGLLGRRGRESGADLAHEGAGAGELLQVAGDLELPMNQRQPPLLDPDRDAREVVTESL